MKQQGNFDEQQQTGNKGCTYVVAHTISSDVMSELVSVVIICCCILHHLKGLGEQVIDLEGLAKHKGSAFGALGESEQPTTEQFENNLAQKILNLDRKKLTWIEDESRNIGKCVLPGEFYAQMRQGELFFLDISREERAKHLVVDYARYDPDDLKACVSKIAKSVSTF